MKKSYFFAITLVALLTFASITQAGGPKAKGGWAPGVTVFDYLRASTSGLTIAASGGAYQRAGQVLLVSTKIGGVGNSTIEFDNSWEWDADVVADGSEIYDGIFHPCALMDIAPRTMFSALPPFDAPTFEVFTYSQTVTITANNGDFILGHVTGGSVCEVEIITDGSINEWLMGIEFDGSENTGRFFGQSGTAYVNFRFNSVTGEFPGIFSISLVLN